MGGELALGLPTFSCAAGISHCLFNAYRDQQPGSGDWKIVVNCIMNSEMLFLLRVKE